MTKETAKAIKEMKIYVVAHENIVCPKEYRKVEIMEEDVEDILKDR